MRAAIEVVLMMNPPPAAFNGAIAACEATGATQLLPGNVYNFGYGVSLGMDETMPQTAMRAPMSPPMMTAASRSLPEA